MKDVFFFGYGSLVNDLTHNFAPVYPATAKGWRRAWVAVPERNLCYLSAIRAPGHEIDGVIAPVAPIGWSELDQREAAYVRHRDTDNFAHDSPARDIAIYAVDPARHRQPDTETAILLSYLDVVIQGYWAQGGAQAALQFFETTSGWETSILDDRAMPRYPRAQSVGASIARYVDAQLDRLNVLRISAGGETAT